MVELQGVPGFREFYPENLAARSHIFAAWREVARRYGFEEYDGPPLEPLEIYTRKSGSEIVGQLYEFEDKGGRRVALRPEMTPTLARMVGSRARSLRKPVRWFSIPQLFRYERQQRGRLREHFQLNLDIIGELDALADAEVLAAGIDVVQALGLDSSQVRARISDRRLLSAIFMHLGVVEGDLLQVYQIVDRLDREPQDRLERRFAELGIRAEVVEEILKVAELRGIDQLEAAFGSIESVSGHVDELSRYLEYLDKLGVGHFVDIDLSVVRGLAYYTGIVFELWPSGRDFRAICGGGRYDDLLGVLAGIDMPAVGFGMGDVVLLELMRERRLVPEYQRSVDCFIVAIGHAARLRALEAAQELRSAGLSVVYEFRERGAAGQFKSAASLGARRAVVIGPEELEAQQARIHDMTSGDEQVVRFARLAEALTQGV